MSTDHLVPEQVVEALRKTGTITGAARELGVNRNTFDSYVRRHPAIDLKDGPAKALLKENARELNHVVSENSTEWGDIVALLESRGLNALDWRVVRARVNQWQEHEQLRVDLEPVAFLPRPARTDGWRPTPEARRTKCTSGLITFMGDHHCPFHDKQLHALAVSFLQHHKPEKIVILGDLLDYGAVSRHRKLGNEPSLQKTIDEAYRVLLDYRKASPGSEILVLEGNHEDRLRNALSDRGLLGVAGVTRAESGLSVLSTAHLLRFDELDITQVFPPEGSAYEHAELKVTSNLAARHGHVATTGSGASALKTLDKLRRNVVIGHTHRQSIVFHTHWDIEDRAHRLVAVEAGCMAEIVNGMGYASAGVPDWQQGFAVAQIHEAGRFTIDLASFVDGTLIWRDHEYS